MAQLIGIAAMPLVTRLYTPAEIGIVSLFLSFFGFWANSLSLRFEHALVIAENDLESHAVHRLAISLVIFMSILGVPVLWLLQSYEILEFALLPAWTPLIALPIFVGNGLFMVYRSWALRGGLVKHITQAAIARAGVAAVTKLGLGFLGSGVTGLFISELVGACASMLKLRQATRHHFSPSKPDNISFTQMQCVVKKFAKFPLLETPSAWIDALALTLPLPLIASLYGAEAAGWFGLARMVVGIPNGQIGAAVADVFQMELAKAIRDNESTRARSLFYALLKKMALLGLIPLFGTVVVLPWAFPLIFGEQWKQAGHIAASLAPWLYAAFIVSPLSRALSVLQSQECKLIYDVSALGLLLGAYFLATTQSISLLEFCLLISMANIMGYLIYALVISRLVESKLQ